MNYEILQAVLIGLAAVGVISVVIAAGLAVLVCWDEIEALIQGKGHDQIR
jgi:hypothetical protein